MCSKIASAEYVAVGPRFEIQHRVNYGTAPRVWAAYDVLDAACALIEEGCHHRLDQDAVHGDRPMNAFFSPGGTFTKLSVYFSSRNLSFGSVTFFGLLASALA